MTKAIRIIVIAMKNTYEINTTMVKRSKKHRILKRTQQEKNNKNEKNCTREKNNQKDAEGE